MLLPGEGHPVVLQLDDGCGRLPSHVVDGVLVTQPVRTLHRVVHVPPGSFIMLYWNNVTSKHKTQGCGSL